MTRRQPAAPPVPEQLMKPAEVWEPWRPSLGQRVRVRLSGECLTVFTYRHAFNERLLGKALHAVELDGAVGTIDDLAEPAEAMDGAHRFHVRFDRPIQIPQGRCHGAAFAAAELLPANEARDEGAEGEG